jgi:hydroxyacylglutathione hydrolase
MDAGCRYLIRMGLSYEMFTGGFCETNAYLVTHDNRRILIDAPDDVGGWLANKGITIEALLLTHQHFDHVMDAARVKADFNCPIYAWAEPSPELWLNRQFSSMTGWSLEVPDYAVDHLLAGLPSLAVAGIEFSLLHVPGHSPDSVCFLDAGSGDCFCGDTIFREGIGRTDFPGGSHRQLLEGICKKLMTLPGEVKLLPGHGPETTVAHEANSNLFLRGL